MANSPVAPPAPPTRRWYVTPERNVAVTEEYTPQASSLQAIEPSRQAEAAFGRFVSFAVAIDAELSNQGCRRQSVIGSRAKRKRTCMTNREWALADRKTNERSLEFMGDNFAAGLY